MLMTTSPPKVNVFCGNYRNEAEAVEHFIECVGKTNLFAVQREVSGEYLSRRPGTEQKSPRADVLLIPRPALKANGWNIGPVAVEVKAPGTKIGPALRQAMDYSQAAFCIRANGVHVVPGLTMLWHVKDVTGDIESLMAQSGIARAYSCPSNTLAIVLGPMAVFRMRPDGSVEVNQPKCGKKMGSR